MTPICPWCGARMLPQVTVEKLVSFRCTNKACLAVSPHAGSFHDAADKAAKRAEKPLKWHDRKSDPPTVPGDYLCEYMFAPEGPLRMTFYGVLSWYSEQRFQHEQTETMFHGQKLVILRWLDFEGGKAQ